MSFEQIVGLVLVVLAMLVGLAGSVLPGIPGPPLILIAAVAHRLWFGEAGPSTWVLATLTGLMVGSLLLDYVATLIGARRLGATWRGVVGAGIGAVVGIFAGLWGILVAPFIGATLGELVGGREFQVAARAGLGAVLGLLAGTVGKVACSAAMIGLFVANVVLRSHGYPAGSSSTFHPNPRPAGELPAQRTVPPVKSPKTPRTAPSSSPAAWPKSQRRCLGSATRSAREGYFLLRTRYFVRLRGAVVANRPGRLGFWRPASVATKEAEKAA